MKFFTVEVLRFEGWVEIHRCDTLTQAVLWMKEIKTEYDPSSYRVVKMTGKLVATA